MNVQANSTIEFAKATDWSKVDLTFMNMDALKQRVDEMDGKELRLLYESMDQAERALAGVSNFPVTEGTVTEDMLEDFRGDLCNLKALIAASFDPEDKGADALEVQMRFSIECGDKPLTIVKQALRFVR